MKKATLTLLMLVAFSYLYCANIKDMVNINERFGNLTVLETIRIPRPAHPSGKRTAPWRYSAKCICDCGNLTTVDQTSLRSGRISGCGCNRKYSHLKHGLRKHPLYKVWTLMRSRCEYHKDPAYKHYGGRGITVCNEWSNPENFIIWSIANGWRKGMSIDRINNNGNYEPSNCRFATPFVQMANRRNTILITVDGVTKCMSAWARFYGISPSTLYERLSKCKDPAYCLYSASMKKLNNNLSSGEELIVKQ